MSQEFGIFIDEVTFGRLALQLASIPGLTEEAVRDFALTAKKMLEGRTPIDNVTKRGRKKAREDHAKYSWSEPQQLATDGGLSFLISNPKPYAITLDRGGYAGVGPRTITASDPLDGHGGIYSRQAPGGMVSPVYLELNVEQVIEQIMQRLENI